MKRVVSISLDADTAAFLDMCRKLSGINDTSAFINALLRHERFRQGFSARSSMDPDDSAAVPLSRKYMQRYGTGLNPHF